MRDTELTGKPGRLFFYGKIRNAVFIKVLGQHPKQRERMTKMADFEGILKNHMAEDGSIPADAIAKLTRAISVAVGNEFVEKSRYKAKLEAIDTLKGEKQTAEEGLATAERWKEKHDKLKEEFDAYKADQTAKETQTAKENAVRRYYESQGITGKALTLALRGSRTEIDAVELENGKIKDTKVLDDLIGGDFSGLVSRTETKGAETSTPPQGSNGTGGTSRRAAQIEAKYHGNLYGGEGKES